MQLDSMLSVLLADIHVIKFLFRHPRKGMLFAAGARLTTEHAGASYRSFSKSQQKAGLVNCFAWL